MKLRESSSRVRSVCLQSCRCDVALAPLWTRLATWLVSRHFALLASHSAPHSGLQLASQKTSFSSAPPYSCFARRLMIRRRRRALARLPRLFRLHDRENPIACLNLRAFSLSSTLFLGGSKHHHSDLPPPSPHTLFYFHEKKNSSFFLLCT